jgi:putative endonuclease
MPDYYVYILRCADSSLYTGITVDINRRVDEHNHSKKGAKYTKMRRPVELIYKKKHPNRSLASKKEHEIKKLSKKQKLELIENQ